VFKYTQLLLMSLVSWQHLRDLTLLSHTSLIHLHFFSSSTPAPFSASLGSSWQHG
jgi:hypothetical protein